MRKIITFLICIYTSTNVFAQVDTVKFYTDFKYNQTRVELANYIFKTYKKDEKSWVFAKHDYKNVILQKETYMDSLLTIKSGPYVEYKNGKPILKGMFVNNMLEGNFISYDSIGRVFEITAYHLDSLYGLTQSFWDNGAKKSEKIYGNKEQLIQSITFYKNGDTAIKEIFSSNGKLVDSLYLDSNGFKTEKINIESPPLFPGGIDKFYQFIGNNLKYPNDATNKEIQGIVYVSYVITETGKIEDIRVERKLLPSIDDEAVRVIKLSPDWRPSMFWGKPVRVKQSVPIRFSIIDKSISYR